SSRRRLSPTRDTLLPYPTLFRSESRRSNGADLRRPPPNEPRAKPSDSARESETSSSTVICSSNTTSRSPNVEPCRRSRADCRNRSEEHTSELQSRGHLVCCLLLE